MKFHCPEGHIAERVIVYTRAEATGIVRRRWKCQACGLAYATVEVLTNESALFLRRRGLLMRALIGLDNLMAALNLPADKKVKVHRLHNLQEFRRGQG